MAEIPLTRGKVAIVDDSDFAVLSAWKWTLLCVKGRFYAARYEVRDGKKTCVLMHRQMKGEPPGLDVDHRDNDGLNNRRGNLRVATRQQNIAAGKGSLRSKVGLPRGVRRANQKKEAWTAHITVSGRQLHLGTFPSVELATTAWRKAARRHFGAFAPVEA